jgi:hypothetical protein
MSDESSEAPPPKSKPQPWPFFESDASAWPTAKGDSREFNKQLDLANLEVRKKRTDQEIALNQAETDADLALEEKFYESVFEVAKGSIDRARASADFVQKGAGAIVAIYGAVLGVAFSVSERPLPARGVLPAFFLGLAIVCATYFIAWLPDPEERIDQAAEEGDSPREQLANTFVLWTKRAALDRPKWLRASVVSLAAGLMFLPAPFVSFGTSHIAATATSWPQPKDAALGANIELRKILYQAQVNQAVAAKPQAVSGKRDWVWWAGAGVALGLIVLLPHVSLRQISAEQESRS